MKGLLGLRTEIYEAFVEITPVDFYLFLSIVRALKLVCFAFLLEFAILWVSLGEDNLKERQIVYKVLPNIFEDQQPKSTSYMPRFIKFQLKLF